MREDGERDDKRNGGKQADRKIHIGDRAHAGDSGEDDHEGSDDLLTVARGDRRKDQVQDVAAADELVTGDSGVGEEYGNDAEDARSLVITSLKQVGNGELGELPRAWSNEIDENKTGPTA